MYYQQHILVHKKRMITKSIERNFFDFCKIDFFNDAIKSEKKHILWKLSLHELNSYDILLKTKIV